MHIIVIGTRGFPYIQGGIETHCEGLYPELVKLGCFVTVVRRKPYITSLNSDEKHLGVTFKDIWAPKLTNLEAIVHTFLAVIYARTKGPDLLHIHGIGPSLFAPFARLLGLKVIVTTQGPDYDRGKWGKFAKFILRFGERVGTKFSNELIVVSEVINQLIKVNYERENAHLIYNGVHQSRKSTSTEYIDSLGLKRNKYIIAVARMVEEKGFDYLIDAYLKLQGTEYKLVLVGDSDHESDYSTNLKKRAKENGIVTTGFIKGEQLNQIFSHARLFILPSFHEGLSLSLLEAISYDLDILASDIPANVHAPLPRTSFFPVGDSKELSIRIKEKLSVAKPQNEYDLREYQWEEIAIKTKKVYEMALNYA